jgi:type II secretory pathway pseudopilin PulG
MLVAISLFTIVMTVSIGALLALVDANRKAQAIQSVINNLNIGLDGMVRQIRMGSQYHCGTAAQSNNLGLIATPANCNGGGTLIGFEPFGGDTSTSANQWAYWLQNNRLYRRAYTDSASVVVPITAPEVRIDSFSVYVTGAESTLRSNPSDTQQPKVVIIIKGTAGAEGNDGSIPGRQRIETDFTIQATASQRLLDI